MIKRYLGDYYNFTCIADRCPATCCSGWAIEIDDDALEYYRSYNGECKELFDKNIDWEEQTFRQKENGDCAFLREDGLCEMICAIGEGALCMTCDRYPRHMEEFPNVREFSLSASCPVAANKLIKQKEKLTYTEEEDSETEEIYEDFNMEIYQKLVILREHIFRILQNRDIPFSQRSREVLDMMKNVQNSIDGFENEKYERHIQPETLFSLLFRLEPLEKNFRRFLYEAKHILFGNGEEYFYEIESEFEMLHPEWEIRCEQISVYFIYTYFCGAAYDDYVYAMAAQAVYNAYMIKLLWIAKWKEKKECLDSEKMAEILYKYSRELEHSNENMILLEQMLDSVEA